MSDSRSNKFLNGMKGGGNDLKLFTLILLIVEAFM